MTVNCEFLDSCGFFRKYRSTKDLACKGFILQFCQGAKMHQCQRKEYRRLHGAPPSDDMMPTGQTIVLSVNRPGTGWD